MKLTPIASIPDKPRGKYASEKERDSEFERIKNLLIKGSPNVD